MKRIFSGLLYALIVTTAWGQSEPITTLQGDQGTKFGSPKLVTPNLQATKTAKGGRIETGNSNLLSNPSFEHTTVNTGWTCSLGTVSTATGTDGTQGLGIVSAGAGVRCYQLSTINVANLKGALGQARAMVKTTDTIMKVCGLVDGNGAANERNCVTVSPTTTDTVFYQAMTQPFQMGGTSNGIVIYTTTTTTQPTVIDAAHVGVVNSSLASFSNSTSPIFFTPTITGVTTSASSCSKQRNLNRLLLDCKFTSNAAGSGVNLTITLPDSLTVSSQLPSLFSVGEGIRGFGASTGVKTLSILTQNGASTISFSYKADGSSADPIVAQLGSLIITGSGQTVTINASIPIAGWEANTNAAVAGCVDAFGCTETFSAFSSAAGVISNPNVTGWVSNASSVSAGIYTFPIRAGMVTGKMNCTATAVGTTRIMHYTEASSSTTQIVFTETNTSTSINDIGFIINCQKGTADFKPKTVVVSPLNGYVKVPGAENLNVESFSVSYGTTNATTVCSASPCSYLDQIGTIVTNITRSGTGAYSLNLNKTYSKLKCSNSPGSSTSYQTSGVSAMHCSNCSAMSFFTGSGGATTDSFGTILCQGTY